VKLLEQCRQTARVKHFSLKTEKSYLYWIERYIRFHGIRHPNEMGSTEVEAFLTDLAVTGRVAASTQNQALGAILFLYRDVLRREIGNFNAVRARRPARVPTVLSPAETARLLEAIDRLPTTEPYGLMARLMYGAALGKGVRNLCL
jgi:site-specific recombinase XerD